MNYTQSPHLIRVFDFDVLHMELNTVLYIFVLVLVVMFLLNKLLFRPVLRTLESRARLMTELEQAQQGHREQMERLAEDYEARLADVRAEVARVRQESGRETQGEVTAILERARQEAQSEFQAAMDDLRQQIDQARQELGEASRALAEQTTHRILQA